MAFEALAYGSEANVLLVIDGSDLIAYDASTEAPKWQVSFTDPLLSVLFAHPQALPSAGGGSPWREAAPTHAAIAVDGEGSLHAVDLHLGKKLGSVGPFGKPRALASCVTTGVLAMAVLGKVLVWRAGHVVETAVPGASALAFSADGKTLAVGTETGDVILLSLYAPSAAATPDDLQPAAPADTLVRSFETHGVGSVADIVPHPSGAWLTAGALGVYSITERGAQRLEKISAGALRARFDATGARLAVQRSERAIVVYAWPALSVVARVELTERPVRGLSFGAGDWLGIALDHGDGNKIDVVTSETHRTDTAPGRTHRSWTLYVEGQSKLLSAKEAEEIRRMKSPFHEESPRAKGNGAGGKIGIGAGLSLIVLVLRVCAHASGSSYSSTYTPYTLPTATPSCDAACAKSRVLEVESDCIANEALGCAGEAAAARKAIAAGHCNEALSAIKRIGSSTASAGTSSATPLFGAHRLLAEFGLDEACRSGAILPPPVIKHAQLVRLGKGASQRSVEALPESSSVLGETPRALVAVPDGTVFAATLTDSPQKCVVYKRTAAGAWTVSFTTRTASGDVALFGRTASDMYVATGRTVTHFDGTSWTNLTMPNEELVDGAAAAGSDVLVATGAAHDDSAVHRRRGGVWTKETTPAGISVLALFGSGSSMWGVGEDADSKQTLLRRTPTGTWSAKSPITDGTSLTVHSVWSSPTGEAFVGTSNSLLRSKDAGTTWAEEAHDSPVISLWGRSSSDVYAIEGDTLIHFDGKTWSNLDNDVAGAQSVTGTANEVLVLRAAPAP